MKNHFLVMHLLTKFKLDIIVYTYKQVKRQYESESDSRKIEYLAGYGVDGAKRGAAHFAFAWGYELNFFRNCRSY